MAQATTGGPTYNQYLLIAGLVVAVATGAFAYHNGFFGGSANDQATPPLDVDGPSTEGTSQ